MTGTHDQCREDRPIKLEDIREAFAHSPGDEFRHPEKPGVWEVVQRFVDVDNSSGPSSPRSYRLMCTTKGDQHCESMRVTEGEIYTQWSMLENVQLPCSNCGAEISHGEDTTATVQDNFEFEGERATRELPAKICPVCGEVTAL